MRLRGPAEYAAALTIVAVLLLSGVAAAVLPTVHGPATPSAQPAAPTGAATVGAPATTAVPAPASSVARAPVKEPAPSAPPTDLAATCDPVQEATYGCVPSSALASDIAAAPAFPIPAGGIAHASVSSLITTNYSELNWTNQSYWTNQTSPVQAPGGSAMAYDPELGYMILFGGGACIFCASNNTFIYYPNEGWYNLTPLFDFFGDPSPPPVDFMGMAYSPLWEGIIMTGGAFANNTYSNQTWLFGASGWENITAEVGLAPPESIYAPLVWDAALGAVVSVDGCAYRDCSFVWNQTELLGAPGTDWTYIPAGPGIAPTWGQESAYDYATADLLFFGGRTNNSNASASNATWIYTPGSDWENITSSAGAFGVYWPAPTVWGGATWDGQLDQIVLFGGDLAGDTLTNQTAVFDGSVWWPAWYYWNDFLVTPPATAYFAMATDSSNVTPAIAGGAGLPNATWTLEVPPQIVIEALTPDPVDVGAPQQIGIEVAVGSGSGGYLNLSVFDFYYGLSAELTLFPANPNVNASGNLTLSYPTTGVDYVFAVAYDFWGLVAGYGYVALDVAPNVTAAVGATPNPAEISGGSATVAFTSTVTPGTSPYSYLWGFGDGGTSVLGNTTHPYTAAGTYHGYLNVSDAGGGYSNDSFAVLVYPQLTATATANVTGTDANLPVAFTGTPGGGSGTYPTESWWFGDGGTGSGTSPSHTYTTPGTYTVYFNVTDSLGFVNSTHFTVKVNSALGGTASASTTTPQAGSSVSFTATATNGTSPYNYSWNFGDGSSAGYGATPQHTFGSAGTYYVNVTIKDAVGISVVREVVMKVSAKPASSALSDLTSGTGLYALIGIIVVIVAIAGVAIALSRRRKQGGSSTNAPGAPQAWNQGGTPPPGASGSAGGPTGGGPGGSSSPPPAGGAPPASPPSP